MNIFKGIAHVLKAAFTNPTAIKLEAGIASVVLPGFGPLIQSAASALISAESTFATAGMQSGTGAQKMTYAVGLFEQSYNTWAAQNNLVQLSVPVQELLQDVFNMIGKFNIAGAAAVSAASLPTTPTVAPVSSPGLISTANPVPAPLVTPSILAAQA